MPLILVNSNKEMTVFSYMIVDCKILGFQGNRHVTKGLHGHYAERVLESCYYTLTKECVYFHIVFEVEIMNVYL